MKKKNHGICVPPWFHLCTSILVSRIYIIGIIRDDGVDVHVE
jgi:hypothetical protein